MILFHFQKKINTTRGRKQRLQSGRNCIPLLSVILSPSVRTFHHHVKGTPQRYSTGKGINQSEKACQPIHKLPLTINLPSLRAFADAHGRNAWHAAESDRGRNSAGGRASAPDDTLVESGHRQRQRRCNAHGHQGAVVEDKGRTPLRVSAPHTKYVIRCCLSWASGFISIYTI